MKATTKRRGAERLSGFSYDPTTGTATFDRYYHFGAKLKRARRTVEASSRDHAIALWAAFGAELEAKTLRPNEELTFRKFFTLCFDLVRARVSKTTAREYAYVAKNHLLDAFGDVKLNAITSGAINAFSAQLVADGYSAWTANAYTNTLCALLSHAVERAC